MFWFWLTGHKCPWIIWFSTPIYQFGWCLHVLYPFGIQILTFKMYLHMKFIWPLCMVICWFYGSFWILVMNRVLVVSVGHLKRALSIFGHGPGIHLNTSELCETESRFSFWFSFYSLTLYVLIKFNRRQPKCPWILYCNLVFIFFIKNIKNGQVQQTPPPPNPSHTHSHVFIFFQSIRFAWTSSAKEN